MSNDESKKVNTDNKGFSKRANEPDAALSLELIKKFQLLDQKNKLEVINFVRRLASSPDQDGT